MSPPTDAAAPTIAPAAAPRRASASDNMRGALWIVFSCLCASVMTISIRYLSIEFDTRMLAFLRSALGAAILLPWFFLPSGGSGMRFSRPWMHVVRGVLTAGALNLGFFAISVLPMATVTILFFLAPVFATALAVPMLGERVGVRRWGAVAAGFVGAAIILRPGFGALEWGMLAAIGSAACFSVSLMLSKIVAPIDGARSVLFSSTLIAAILTLPIALPVWSLDFDAIGWLLLGVLIGSSTLRMYSDIRAYAIGDAGFLAPFSYLRLVILAAAGWFLFSEVIDGYTLAGGAVIIGATLYIAQREARLNLRIAGGAGP